MFDGFLKYDDVLIVNAEMTKAIAQANGLSWFEGCEGCDTKNLPSDFPEAPWWDINFPRQSSGFAGLVVTSMTPFLNSRATRQVTPLARGGAALGRRHEQHREVVVGATLIAKDRESAVFGLEWLTDTLQFGGKCGETTRDRTGFDTEVWLWCPNRDDEAHRRFLYDVHVTTGPTVLREVDVHHSCGGHIIDVEFTLTAGNPGIYGVPHAFGELVTGSYRDSYIDLRTLAANGSSSVNRTYDDVKNMVQPAPDTSYNEVLAALIIYGDPGTPNNDVWG